MPQFVQAALLSAPFASLTYAVPDFFAHHPFPRGLRVLVPLGKTLRAAVIESHAGAVPQGVRIRDLVWPLETEPLLDEIYLDMARNLAGRQMLSLGGILGNLLPTGLRTSKTFFETLEAGLWKSLDAKRISGLPEARKRELARLWDEGGMRPKISGQGGEPLFALAAQPPWPVRPGAKSQLAILDRLYDQGPAPVSRLRADLGAQCVAALKRLVEMGVVRPVHDENPSGGEIEALDEAGLAPDCGAACFAAPLTPDQETAMSALNPALDAFSGEIRLLHGVTGSGKTRVYLELARRCLAAGRRVALLAPEVALAAQLLRSVKEAFPGERVVFTHGYLPPSRREAAFREAAAENGPRIVVGARSALFLPVRDPGLIVLDEEHDASFKQDERMAYQAKEVAFYIAKRTGALLVLGSATPDVKTYFAAGAGAAPKVVMQTRAGEGQRPEIEIVDMRGAVKTTLTSRERETGDRAGVLTGRAAEALRETVKRGEQAVIMLNRRGYAPLLYCLSCERTLRCPQCDLALTYHKGRERLVCHYCGLIKDFPSPCPDCGSADFLPMGVGSELLEEQLAGILPAGARVLRLDRDSSRKTGRLDEIIAQFAAGEAQVLVGTQMLSKGHHFPKVTLAVAADADMGRNLPDYRSAERTFQLLVQVCGRAGRGGAGGRALIQTRNPEDPFWKFVIEGDYEGFYESELEKRRRFSYPPFSKLGLIRLSHPRDDGKGAALVAGLGSVLREQAAAAGVTALGPAPAPLGLIAGRLRFNCLLKAKDWPAIRRVFAAVKAAAPSSGDLRVSLDLDPVDML